MLLEERIRKKQHEILKDFCRNCSDTCCDSRKHLIPVNSVSLPLFQGQGIPLIKFGKLNKSSLKQWGKHPDRKIFFRNGDEVPKPSIVPYGGFMFGYGNYLYADACPFYSEKGGCRVHEDSRRPQDCKDYPIAILPESNEPAGKYIDICVMKTCPHREELISGLAKDFPIKVIG